MRLRIPELLKEKGLTPYALAKRSGGRILMSTAYRLVSMRGALGYYEAELLQALADVLEVGPGELFEDDGGAERRRQTRRVLAREAKRARED